MSGTSYKHFCLGENFEYQKLGHLLFNIVQKLIKKIASDPFISVANNAIKVRNSSFLSLN